MLRWQEAKQAAWKGRAVGASDGVDQGGRGGVAVDPSAASPAV